MCECWGREGRRQTEKETWPSAGSVERGGGTARSCVWATQSDRRSDAGAQRAFNLALGHEPRHGERDVNGGCSPTHDATARQDHRAYALPRQVAPVFGVCVPRCEEQWLSRRGERQKCRAFVFVVSTTKETLAVALIDAPQPLDARYVASQTVERHGP